MTSSPVVLNGPGKDWVIVQEILGEPLQILPITHARWWTCFICWFLVAGFALTFVALFLAWVILPVAERWPLVPVLGTGLALAFLGLLLACFSLLLVPRGVGMGNYLLVGPNGFAEWTRTVATVVLWADLGDSWQKLLVEDEDAVVVLGHASGLTLKLSHYYTGVHDLRNAIDQRLLRKQRPEATLPPRSGSTERISVLKHPLPERNESPSPAPVPTTVEAWLESEAAQAIAPVEYVADLTPHARQFLQQQLLVSNRIARFFLLAAIVLVVAFLVSIFTGSWTLVPWYIALGPCLLGVFFVGWLGGTLGRAEYVGWLASRIVVGEHGYAIWKPAGTKAYLWLLAEPDWLPEEPPDQRRRKTRLLTSEMYEQGERFEEHCRAELRRRQEQTGPDGQTSVPGRAWLESRVAQEIAPLELVAGPTAAAKQSVKQGLWGCSFLVGVAGALLVIGVRYSGLVPGFSSAVASGPLLVLLGLLTYWASVASSWCNEHERMLDNRILLGARGLVFWSPEKLTVLLWDDLGQEWRATLDIPKAERRAEWFPVRLKIQTKQGTFLVSDFYEEAGRIADRVVAELQRPRERKLPTAPSNDILAPDTELRPEQR
jgi:hypothetical protein